MSNMQIYLRIRSEYDENDTSRYRHSVTKQTLIPSLKNQVHDGYAIILMQNESDKHFAARASSFASVGARKVLVYDDPIPHQHIMIEIGDNDFLSPSFMEYVQRTTKASQNTQLTFPHGYIFHNKQIRNWRNHPDFAQVHMIVEPGDIIREEKVCDQNPAWIHCRHQMNDIPIPDAEIQGLEIQGLNWKGWNQTLVSTYCSIAIKTGTAVGCVPGPQRSNSLVFGDGQRKKRRRMKF